MTPIELKELLAEIQAEIPAIKRTICLIDDSDLADFTGDLVSGQMALVGIIPSYGHRGKVGSSRSTPIFQLDIIEKTDYSALDNDNFVLLYDRTLKIMEQVLDFILEKVEDGCYPKLPNIDITSIQMDPIKKKSQCNGWSMDILTT